MPPGDSPAKAIIISFAALMVLVILTVIAVILIGDPSDFFRHVESWIEENL